MALRARAGRGDPDPFGNYAFLRAHEPVCPIVTAAEEATTWLVTRHDDVRTCLADPRLSNDRRHSSAPPPPTDGTGLAPGMSDLDLPDHARLRRLVTGFFSPGTVNQARARIERLCHDTIDSFAHAGEADLVEAYTRPVPVAVIHQFLGIPPAERAAPNRIFELSYQAGFVSPPNERMFAELLDYVRHLLAYKRAHPGDDVTTALLSALDRGELHSENELWSVLVALIGAGHVSTVQFLGTSIIRLTQHRDRWANAPWRDVLNELLRRDPPVHAAEYRYALEDLTIAGTAIAKGDRLLISLASANHDNDRFADASDFRPDRDARSHLSFGHGVHLCLGSHLARLEGEVALKVLFDRLPDLELTTPVADVVWGYGPMLRGPKALPATFGPAQG
ncbi:hypothetical protein BS329_35335 [Amycolatopsis coloradensis]|uniref:Cytochrome n=1 Tax=Amycolatopsis coloradensis TaxID=76021 RepID=A0A1R0KH82_9PSEU|nr:cytochrome P450 [Amycolatopsis coloradensis]OLZ45026.1 hypothetical protein BS329_35335 [Amycolatopsis coloradensis]